MSAKSGIELVFAKQAVQGITSAVLESAVLGTRLEDAIKNNLQGALINTVAAKGANQIGDAKLDGTSKAIAHALLGCSVGTATAGNSSGCAPGAAGGAIGELVASLYGNSQDLGGLEDRLKSDPNNAQLKAQVDQVRNTVTELAKLSGAGAALLIGGDATDMKTAMGTASNAAVNNYLNHSEGKRLSELQEKARAGTLTPREADERQALIDKDARTNAAYTACGLSNSADCNAVRADYARAQASYLPEQEDIRAWAEKKAAAASPYTVQQLVDAYNVQYSHGADALPKGTGDISDAADWVRSTIASDIKNGAVDGFDRVTTGATVKANATLNVGLGAAAIGGIAVGKATLKAIQAAKGVISIGDIEFVDAGSIRNVNPNYPTPGRTQNCVNCSVATDATLGGTPATALPSSGPVSVSVLEKHFGTKFSSAIPKEYIELEMITAGEGSRGIVLGLRGPGQVGHVFNVVNQNGIVRFLGGQTGAPASFSGFKEFRLLKTTP